MTISSQLRTSVMDTVAQAQTTHADMSVEVLKKSQEIQKREGNAIVDMLPQAAQAASNQTLDVFA